MAQEHKTVNNNWDGSPTTLSQFDQVTMPVTPAGSVIFAWWNRATTHNDGQLALTAGGNPPQMLDAPAFARRFSTMVADWAGNSLTVTNISIAPATPIWIAMFWRDLPGVTPPASR